VYGIYSGGIVWWYTLEMGVYNDIRIKKYLRLILANSSI